MPTENTQKLLGRRVTVEETAQDGTVVTVLEGKTVMEEPHRKTEIPTLWFGVEIDGIVYTYPANAVRFKNQQSNQPY